MEVDLLELVASREASFIGKRYREAPDWCAYCRSTVELFTYTAILQWPPTVVSTAAGGAPGRRNVPESIVRPVREMA